jgi:hypothetical protein
MRFFDLLGIQHFVLYLFPALAFIVLFIAGLKYSSVQTKDSEERQSRIIEKYPGGIEGRDAPFPFVLTLTIAGTIVWGLLYILFIGKLGVKI